jgi:hypothetical protein
VPMPATGMTAFVAPERDGEEVALDIPAA